MNLFQDVNVVYSDCLENRHRQFSMGASTSKAAKTAAGAARRQYPQRVPPPPTSNTSSATSPPAGQPTAPGPTVHPQVQASNTHDECKLYCLFFFC